MVKLLDFLKEEWVIPDLSGTDKVSVLKELSGILTGSCSGTSSEELLQILLEREKLGSTGIGEGVAIPHCRRKGADHFCLSFGRSRHGVDFDSIDQKPCHLFFMVMAPENSAVENLHLLGRIARLLKDVSFKKKLMGAATRKEIFDIISEEDKRY